MSRETRPGDVSPWILEIDGTTTSPRKKLLHFVRAQRLPLAQYDSHPPSLARIDADRCHSQSLARRAPITVDGPMPMLQAASS